jgi:hypothetical protein
VAGPRAGQKEAISAADVDKYREEAEKIYGKYIPGGLFSEPRFISGTKRSTLPLVGPNGGQIGHIDKNGVQYYDRWSPRYGGV